MIFLNIQITLDRVLPYWENVIAPSVKSGKRVVVAAHGNSLRALGKLVIYLKYSEIEIKQEYL